MAHRADGLVRLLGHRHQDHTQILPAVAEKALTPEQRLQVGLDGQDGAKEAMHVDPVLFDPAPIGLAAGDAALDLGIPQQAVVGQIGENHLAGPQRPAFGNGLGRQVDHAALGGQHDEAVMREGVAGRAEPVAVEHRADDGAIAEGHGGGAVPRLHQPGVIFEEASLVGTERIAFAPGLGHQHHHGVRQIAAGPVEQFQHVVEGGGIAAARLDDGPHFANVVAQQSTAERALARVHLADVAAEGVDLAVVRELAEGLGQFPGGKRVSAVALVNHGQRGAIVRRGQVEVEAGDLPPHQHAFVDDRAAREADGVEARLGTPEGADLLLHLLACHVELAVQGLVLQPVSIDKYLQDRGTTRPRLRTQHRVVDRHFAPGQLTKPLIPQHGGDNGLTIFPDTGVRGKEEHADTVPAHRRQRDIRGR